MVDRRFLMSLGFSRWAPLASAWLIHSKTHWQMCARRWSHLSDDSTQIAILLSLSRKGMPAAGILPLHACSADWPDFCITAAPTPCRRRSPAGEFFRPRFVGTAYDVGLDLGSRNSAGASTGLRAGSTRAEEESSPLPLTRRWRRIPIRDSCFSFFRTEPTWEAEYLPTPVEGGDIEARAFRAPA